MYEFQSHIPFYFQELSSAQSSHSSTGPLMQLGCAMPLACVACSFRLSFLNLSGYVCVCVCVCTRKNFFQIEREREREREREKAFFSYFCNSPCDRTASSSDLALSLRSACPSLLRVSWSTKGRPRLSASTPSRCAT